MRLGKHRAARTSKEHVMVEWAQTALAKAGFHEALILRDFTILTREGMSERNAAGTIREALEAAEHAYRITLMTAGAERASDTKGPDTGRIARVKA